MRKTTARENLGDDRGEGEMIERLRGTHGTHARSTHGDPAELVGAGPIRTDPSIRASIP